MTGGTGYNHNEKRQKKSRLMLDKEPLLLRGFYFLVK